MVREARQGGGGFVSEIEMGGDELIGAASGLGLRYRRANWSWVLGVSNDIEAQKVSSDELELHDG